MIGFFCLKYSHLPFLFQQIATFKLANQRNFIHNKLIKIQ